MFSFVIYLMIKQIPETMHLEVLKGLEKLVVLLIAESIRNILSSIMVVLECSRTFKNVLHRNVISAKTIFQRVSGNSGIGCSFNYASIEEFESMMHLGAHCETLKCTRNFLPIKIGSRPFSMEGLMTRELGARCSRAIWP